MIQKLFAIKCRDAMLASETIQNNCNHPDVGVPFSLRRRVRDEVQSHSSMRKRVSDKVIALLVFIITINFATAQTRPSDSLYVWVNFTEDRILINIPESYMTYRNAPPALPKHVRINEVNRFVPQLPGKETLLYNLKSELLSVKDPQTKGDQIKYLGKIVLMLFYSHNDLSSLPDESLKTMDTLIQDSQVKKEAALVKKWVEMIKMKSPE